jgi:hypothetical protein
MIQVAEAGANLRVGVQIGAVGKAEAKQQLDCIKDTAVTSKLLEAWELVKQFVIPRPLPSKPRLAGIPLLEMNKAIFYPTITEKGKTFALHRCE